MKQSAVTKYEASLKLDRRKVEKAIDQLIFEHAEDIINVQIDAAKAGSLQAGQYLIDRAFGKARQTVGLDGGSEGAPIVFMPSTLVNKFDLDKPLELPAEEVKEDGRQDI